MRNWYLITLLAFLTSCTTSKNLIKKGIFTNDQKQLVMAADSKTPMRIFKIDNKQDSVLLRAKSFYVKPDANDPVLINFVDRLYSTVRDSMSLGVGIAAPQVGILKNIIWVQRFDKEDAPFEVYLNPKIIEYSKKTQECPEGCLSIPDRREVLNSRAYSIKIEYDKLDATHQTEVVDDFTAVIFQHEIDHLNGILFLDHLKEH